MKYGDRMQVNTEAIKIAYDYIRYRLRKDGYDWWRCPASPNPSRACLVVRELGEEFEQLYSEQYGHLSQILSATRLTTYPDFLVVCKELFRGEDYSKFDDIPDVKWSRIVALFVFGGVLAVQFTRNGLDKLLPRIADWIYIYIRNTSRLSLWICKRGGWEGMVEYYETRLLNKKWDSIKVTITGVGVVCGVVALAAMVASRL